MLLHKDIKLADALHHNPLLLPVINRLGVELGFGDMSIEEACDEEGVDTYFFLLIVNAFLDKNVGKIMALKDYSVLPVIKYLQSTHRYYLERMVPEMEIRINTLIQQSDINHKQYLLVKNFFEEYVKELFSHIKLEEEKIYPYIIQLHEAAEAKKADDTLLKQISKVPISFYAKEHSDIESKLTDLKNILIKYLARPKDSFLRNQVLEVLFRLENDIRDHSRIEDNVLVPMVENMEAALIKLNAKP